MDKRHGGWVSVRGGREQEDNCLPPTNMVKSWSPNAPAGPPALTQTARHGARPATQAGPPTEPPGLQKVQAGPRPAKQKKINFIFLLIFLFETQQFEICHLIIDFFFEMLTLYTHI